MKKNVIVVSFLLFTIILQSCGHVSKETAFLNTSAQWAKKDPGGFVEKGYIGIGVKLNTDDEIEIIHVA
ncbi:MAG: hypothetical protein NTZ24_11820, partial [Deltaproteobacteria bacterium]|nr:hypothetical protein [Deltaproteobacteria bacterium]